MVHGATSPMGSQICAMLARHPLVERFVSYDFALLKGNLVENFYPFMTKKI